MPTYPDNIETQSHVVQTCWSNYVTSYINPLLLQFKSNFIILLFYILSENIIIPFSLFLLFILLPLSMQPTQVSRLPFFKDNNI